MEFSVTKHLEKSHIAVKFLLPFQKAETIEMIVKLLILCCGLCLAFAGVWLNAPRLIEMGVMDASLQHSDPLVRATTEIELQIVKWFLVLLGLCLVVTSVFHTRIVASTTYARVVAWARPAPFHSKIYKSPEAIGVLIAFGLGLIYIYFGATIFEIEMLRKMNREDGVVESLSVVFLALAAGLALLSSVKFEDDKRHRFALVFLAVLFIVMAGEEISWGQRILGLETPEAIKNINVQGETNFHNMFGYFFDHAFITAFFLWGFVMPALKKAKFFNGLFHMFGLPVATFPLAITALLITLLQETIVHALGRPFPGLRIPEVRELLSAIFFFALMVETYRLRDHVPAIDPVPSRQKN